MKTITTLTIALALVVGTAYAKPLPQSSNPVTNSSSKKMADVFGTFHAHRQGDFASLNWNVLSGDVFSFRIERSYGEGFPFEPIAILTPDAARWNRYTDESVEPGVIYYRVVAVMNDGMEEYSATESVKIVKHK